MVNVIFSLILFSGFAGDVLNTQLPTIECQPPQSVTPTKPKQLPPQKTVEEEKDSISETKKAIRDTIDDVLYSSIEVKKTNFCTSKFYVDHLTGKCEMTRICKDHTVSFVQPEDSNWGYEGKCGPTAAANLLTMACGTLITPKNMEEFGGDLNPGWRPSTLRSALNSATTKINQEGQYSPSNCPSGTWQTTVSDSFETHFQKLKESPKPLAALLFIGPLSIHWVTVTSITGENPDSPDCTISYNDVGINSQLSCSAFMQKSASAFGSHYFVRFHSN